MRVLDIRKQEAQVDGIRFSEDQFESHDTTVIASIVEKWNPRKGCVRIRDSAIEYVVLKDEEHALNLIKALNKAIELKWFDK